MVIKKNYIWNMLGTILSALVSVVLLLIASRYLVPEDSDIFTLIYSLSNQLIIVGIFQVRNFQSTDVGEQYLFSEYLITRLITILMMILLAILFLLFNKYSGEKLLIFLFTVLYRASDAFSDVFQGYFQQHNRSDLAGKILFVRSLSVMVLFTLSLIFTKSLLYATILICVVNFLLIFLLDIPMKRCYFLTKSFGESGRFSKYSIRVILVSCFPLFLNGFLLNYIFNEPKIVIDRYIEIGNLPVGMQRDFNILFMPSFVLNLLLLILRPLITNLSDIWTQNLYEEFYMKIKKIAVGLTFFGILVLILGFFFGTEVLSWIYNVKLSSYRLEFMLLLLAGIFNMFSMLIDNLVTIFRKQQSLLIVNIVIFVLSKLLTNQLVIHDGMLGAAQSLLIVMIVYFVLSVWVYYIFVRLERRRSL